MMPYGILISIGVNTIMLISMIVSVLHARENTAGSHDVYMTYEFLSILAVLSCVLLIYCLCGILDLSDKLRPAQILLVVAVVISSTAILTTAYRIYNVANGNEHSAMMLDYTNHILNLIKECVYAVVLFLLTKGFGEAVVNAGEFAADGKEPEKDYRRMASQLEKTGLICLVSNLVLTAMISASELSDYSASLYIFTAYYIVSVILELIVFLMLKRSTTYIWQCYYSRNLVKQGSYKTVRGVRS